MPLVLGLLALLLRLHGLADKPLWYDEILSLNRARLPLADLIIDALKHKHYPTYFLLLRSFASGACRPMDAAIAVRPVRCGLRLSCGEDGD